MSAAPRPIRVGLIGCGRISRSHLQALAQLPDQYQLVAVCDPLRERASAAAQESGAAVFTDLGQLLSSKPLDLVVLTTPSGLHPRQALQALEHRVACLSEKPFGVSWDEAREVVERFESAKVPLFVVKQNRFNPTVAAVHRWLTEGKLGRLHLIQSNVFWQRPDAYYRAEAWRGTREMDGGALMNQASHYVDLVTWFGGEVEQTQALRARLGRKIECEDTAVVQVRFRSGALASLSVTMLTYPENWEGSISLLCEKASLRIGGKALNRIENFKCEDPSLVAEAETLSYEPNSVYGNGHVAYYRELAQDLRAHPAPAQGAVTGRESLRSLQVLSEAYRSQIALPRIAPGN